MLIRPKPVESVKTFAKNVSDVLDSPLLADIKKIMPSILMLTAVINLLLLVPTIYMLQVYDRVMSSYSIETLIAMSGLTLVLYGLQVCLEWVRSKALIRVSNAMDVSHARRIYKAAFFAELLAPGKYSAQQALNDFNTVRQFATGSGILILLDAPWVPFYLALMFLFHPVVGVYSIIGGLILFIINFISEKITKKRLSIANDYSMKALQVAGAQSRNAEIVEALGMYSGVEERWQKFQKEYLKHQTAASDLNTTLTSTSKFVRLSMQSLILGVGAYLAIHNEISGGMVIAGSVLMGKALAPIELLIGNWKSFIAARVSWNRITALLEGAPEDADVLTLPAPKGHVLVEDIAITPRGNKKILVHGLNLNLPPSTVLAIIGASGSGKSSIARALVGTLPIVQGHIRLDGAELSQYGRETLAQYIGYVPQSIELFEGTIAENIARLSTPDSEKVINAAQLAGCHQMILQFEEGYQTQIGADGAGLSGGQKQRIGLARALYGNPRFVVLDEPNSNLDEEGDMALLQCLNILKAAEVTTVVISHRPNLLKVSSQLLVMGQGGTPLAYGPTDKVLEALKQNQSQS